MRRVAEVNKKKRQKNTEKIPVRRINKINSPNSIAVKVGEKGIRPCWIQEPRYQ